VTTRYDGRRPDELRPFSFQRDFTTMSMGSVLVTFGDTRVLCTASVEESVPRWMKGLGEGWVTAEYSMLPGSSPERVNRERQGAKGRTQEIERLIGRSLRAVTDMKALGETSIRLDCDVLQADGGTRTAAICGAYIALHDACSRLVQARAIAVVPLTTECAAISVGIVDGRPVLDLPYPEDSRAGVDCNVIMTGSGQLIEVQGTAEGATFSRAELDELLDLAAGGIETITAAQRDLLAEAPTPRSPGR
jgi:ribonuclease PH